MLKDILNYETVVNKIPKLSFIEPSCQSMFMVINDMYSKLGYTNIDRVSLIGYCDRLQFEEGKKKEVLRTFDTVIEFYGNDTSFDFEGVFEEYSMISATYKFHGWVNGAGGIDEVAQKLLKLKNMSEVNQVIEGRLLEFFNTGTADASIKDTNLTEMMDDKFLKSIEDGDEAVETVPLLKQFYILNKITKGMVRGATGFGAWSGVGKSSFMYSVYVQSILENTNSKIAIYANEQTAKVFAIGMAFAFISQVVNMKQDEFKCGFINLSRDKFTSGNYSEKETSDLVKIMKVFRSRYKNRVTHSFFEDMTPNALRRDIRRKFREGHKYFFYDTFKSNDEDYSSMMHLASVADQLTKKYPIHFYMSLQLSDESIGTKYLTNKCLASARGTKRVMETLLLMRKLDVEELATLKVHKLGHEDQSINIDLKNKNYYALFVDKNRNGATDVVILFEIYLDILKYKEIGIIANMPKDDLKYAKKKK